MIPREVWCLPRPRKPYSFKGGFPLYFENKLLKLLEISKVDAKSEILHMFGGASEFGTRVDIRSETNPDILGDCHDLKGKLADNSFRVVILDPPYSDEESTRLYGTGKINMSKCMREAYRLCKVGGFIVAYHRRWVGLPVKTVPYSCVYWKQIVILTRVGHEGRICTIFRKLR